jgi:predicted GNAT family acetyltransferase
MRKTVSYTIRHEPETRRFAADIDGKAAYITYRDLGNGVLDLDHTYVPREHRGGGIASQLTAHALDYARLHDYRVIPSCPFVAAYLERHPQYQELRV